MPIVRPPLPLLGALVVFAALLASAFGSPVHAEPANLTAKLNAYVGCINRLSERSHDSRARYFSWVGKSGPTGKERIIYGLYTIYDTADCRKAVEKANALEPRDEALEGAASAYVAAVGALEPLLKEADDYYTQQDYKDDRMAKGKALHPRLVSAWMAFAHADETLRLALDLIQERRAVDQLAEIEAREGRKARYHVEAVAVHAKRVLRAETASPLKLASIKSALAEYEAAVKAMEAFATETKDSGIDSSFVGGAKSLLVTAKHLMRRIRDRVSYSQGDRMMLNAGSGWMVEGSPARLVRDYNQFIDSYNRRRRF